MVGDGVPAQLRAHDRRAAARAGQALPAVDVEMAGRCAVLVERRRHLWDTFREWRAQQCLADGPVRAIFSVNMWDRHDGPVVAEIANECFGLSDGVPNSAPQLADEVAFVPQEVLDEFSFVRADITTLRESTQTKDEVFEDLQTLSHNVAYLAARYENATAGLDSSEGTTA